MAKLTDRQRKNMVADRVGGASIRDLAKKYKVSTTTIQRVLKSDTKLTQEIEARKEQNTQDVLAYMDSKAVAFKAFVDYVYSERLDPQKNREELAKLSLPQLMTIFGISADKMIKTKEVTHRQQTDASRLELEALRLEGGSADGASAAPLDDGFLEALNATAAVSWDRDNPDDAQDDWTGDEDNADDVG